MRHPLLTAAVLFATIRPAFAGPLDIPPALKPWTQWVLRGHENEACPFLNGSVEIAPVGDANAPAPVAPSCLWPSHLDLDLGATSGKFSQEWHVLREAWVALPGDAAHWPQDVKVDGKPAAVVPGGDMPLVFLSAGDHAVSGSFAWAHLPESLHVPPATGLLKLVVSGKPVALPSRDASGLLWVQRETTVTREENRLAITVHRLIADEIPLLVTTRIRIEVSGKSREELFSSALLDGFVPLTLSSELPTRVEPDGKVRVQVRPGTWTLDVIARHDGPVAALTLPKPDGPWSPQEVWAFDARPDLRVVEVTGPPAVDPAQTTLPPEWAQFPAYKMEPEKTMALQERRRGDAEPAPDRLAIHRTLWLDFDGSGYTAQDHITGTMTKSWRLNMTLPTQLGHVAVNTPSAPNRPGEAAPAMPAPAARSQVISHMSPPAGIEIRQTAVSIDAESRIEGNISDPPAVSWDADFHKAGAVLELPPGWRLVYASGVDEASGTWMSKWRLLQFFLVLLVSAAVLQLFGQGWGMLALLGLSLSFTESYSPHLTWVFPLAFEALLRVLPDGRLTGVLRFGRLASWLVLALVLSVFAVDHVRKGIHPVLEHPYETVTSMATGGDVTAAFEKDEPAPDTANGYDNDIAIDGETTGALRGAFGASAKALAGNLQEKKAATKSRTLSWDNYANNAGQYAQQLDMSQIDPTSAAQTGPGVPQWHWNEIALKWSGPVQRTQKLHLFLLSPFENGVLAFVRVALLGALFLLLVGRARGAKFGGSTAALATVLALAIFGGAPARAEEIPDPATQELLRERLLEKPSCYPNCASISRMLLDARPDSLTIREEVSASAKTAVPLPGGLEHWSPQQVEIDGRKPLLRRADDGTMWIELSPGLHQITLTGLLSHDSAQVSLPLKPMRVDSKLEGWTLDGVQENGVPQDSLQLTRVAKANGKAEAAKTLEPGVLPAFVRVERALLLGLDWQVQTRVTRLSPEGTPIVMSIPLLPNESVTTPDVRVENGQVAVNMGPHGNEVSWRSVLAMRGGNDLEAHIDLAAPKNTEWTEIWRLEANPTWHVDMSGIPPIHGDPTAASRIPEWRPWPGESVSFKVKRPLAVAGKSITIEETDLSFEPGIRSTDASLTLRLTSSRGGKHTITLPEGAALQSLAIDGRALPVQQDGRKVELPIHPGQQSFKLEWRENAGLSSFYKTPEVDVGETSVNAKVNVTLSHERWLLFAFGPALGPAVLFWTLLFVVILIAGALGRVKVTPLRWYQWMLLLIGLTQVPVEDTACVVVALLLLGWRGTNSEKIRPRFAFNLLQIGIVVLLAASVEIMYRSVRTGLAGIPNMQVEGNQSSASSLHWFQDRALQSLPHASVLSVSLEAYRIIMLFWALWLAMTVVGQARWGWAAFSAGGFWRVKPKKVKTVPVAPPVVAPPPEPAKG